MNHGEGRNLRGSLVSSNSSWGRNCSSTNWYHVQDAGQTWSCCDGSSEDNRQGAVAGITPGTRIRQTEPCGPLRGGGPEPYGRWKWTFSDGNREPWSGDGGWAGRYASFGYTSYDEILCSIAPCAIAIHVFIVRTQSYRCIITEKTSEVNNFFS